MAGYSAVKPHTITWASNYNSSWIAVIGMHIDDEGSGAAVEVVSSPHNITSDIVAQGGPGTRSIHDRGVQRSFILQTPKNTQA